MDTNTQTATPSISVPTPRLDPYYGKPLTQREKEVLAELAGGRTNQETAANLNISIKTVEAHRARLFKKLGANNGPQAVVLAYQARLLVLPLSVYQTEELVAELVERRRQQPPAPGSATCTRCGALLTDDFDKVIGLCKNDQARRNGSDG